MSMSFINSFLSSMTFLAMGITLATLLENRPKWPSITHKPFTVAMIALAVHVSYVTLKVHGLAEPGWADLLHGVWLPFVYTSLFACSQVAARSLVWLGPIKWLTESAGAGAKVPELQEQVK